MPIESSKKSETIFYISLDGLDLEVQSRNIIWWKKVNDARNDHTNATKENIFFLNLRFKNKIKYLFFLLMGQ